MCLQWGKIWVFISQKTTFFIVTALKTSNLTNDPLTRKCNATSWMFVPDSRWMYKTYFLAAQMYTHAHLLQQMCLSRFILRTRGSNVSWGAMLPGERSRVQFLMTLLKFFSLYNTSSRIIVLELTQSLAEMCTRNIPGECGLVVKSSGCKPRGPGFNFRRYEILWVAVGLDPCPPSPCEDKWGAT
jgi:hypothetical protein